jgi:small subunit ribosomal protein S3
VVSRRSRAAAHPARRHRLRFSEAKTTYGIIGVKVWVYKGDTLGRNDAPVVEEVAEDKRPRRNARPGDRRPRRDGEGGAGCRRGAPRRGAGKPEDGKTGE